MLTPIYTKTETLEAVKGSFSGPVADYFAGSPNEVLAVRGELQIPPDISQALTAIDPATVPEAVLARQAYLRSTTLAPSQAEFVRDGKNKWPDGFDGPRMVATLIEEHGDDLVLYLRTSTFSMRRAFEDLATKFIPQGIGSPEDLTQDNRIFEPREFHLHVVIFTDDGRIVLQERGHSDGTDTLHLCGVSGGLLPKHLGAADTLHAGILTQIHREFGDAESRGITPTDIRALSHERVRIGEEGAATQYLAGVRRFQTPDGGLPSFEDISAIVEAKFIENSRQKIPGTEDPLPVNRWQVKGYAFAELDPRNVLRVVDGTLETLVTRIRATEDDQGLYAGMSIETDPVWMPIYDTIAPTARFYMDPENPVCQRLRERK